MSKRNRSTNKGVSRTRWGNSVLSALPLGMTAGVAMIAVVAFLAYLPSISGGYVLDDNCYVTNSGLIRAPGGLYQFWCTSESIDYWPASNTTFWIEWRLWGMHPTGYHVTNLIFHIVESLLIWVILRKLSIPGAFLAAVLFAVHPVNVESVAWIAQRKDVTAMLFFLLSILWYMKADMPTASVGMAPSPFSLHPLPLASCHLPLWYWLSFLAFVLAMLSKGSAAVLPALLLGILWWMRPLTRWDYVRLAPFFLVGVALALVNVWFQRHGSGDVIRAAGLAERLAGAGCVVWFYLYKAVMPIDLSFVYQQWSIEADNLLWWAPLLAALAVTAVLWVYRGSWGRPLLFAWGFFCVSLVPVLGFADVGFMKHSLVADRYQHIAIIGVIALAAAGLSGWQKRAGGAPYWAATAVAVVAAGGLAFLTLRQSGLYHDAKTLYQVTLVKNPDCWMVRNNLGSVLVEEGRVAEGIEQFKESLALNPEYPDAHSNLAMALAQTGRPREAIKHCEEALRLNPNYPQAHHNLGLALIDVGRLPEAIEHFRKTLMLEPEYSDAENALGSALVRTGRAKEALAHFEKALSLKPNFANAHFNLGCVLASCGRYQEAIEHYQRALALNPNDPDYYYLMGGALMETGQPRQALGYLQQALRLRPDFPEVYYNLALAYARMQQTSQAIAAARKGLELARSKGQAALAKTIEDWLKSYQNVINRGEGREK